MLKPEAIDLIMENRLFESYQSVKEAIRDNGCKTYCPIYSYGKEEEAERLEEFKMQLEAVIEWYVGDKWREKYALISIKY